jgi:hypothetical protein
MRFVKITTALFLSQLILACSSVGGTAVFNSSEKNASYNTSIDSLKVFVDVSAIGAAGGSIENIAQVHSDASQSLVNAFKTKMSEAGVNALVKPFGNVTSTKTDTSTTVTSESIGTEKMVASESSNSQPILIVHIGSSQARNHVWNGMVSWKLDLVDPSVWTSKNKITIWTGVTKLMQFGPSACSSDAYKSCADKFAGSVIAQLRTENLIK